MRSTTAMRTTSGQVRVTSTDSTSARRPDAGVRATEVHEGELVAHRHVGHLTDAGVAQEAVADHLDALDLRVLEKNTR